MNTHRRIFWALFAAALLVLGSACGGDEDATNNATAANNGSDAGNNSEPDVEESDVPQDFEYESEYDLRITEFSFEAETPGSDLNSLLRTSLEDQHEKYPVVVLMHFKDIDTEAGTFSLRGGAGLKADLDCDPEEVTGGECEYEWDPQSPDTYTEEAPFDSETGELTGSLPTLDFIATFEVEDDVEKAVIPIKDIELDGALLPFSYTNADDEVVTEVRMEEAELTGHITQEDAEDTGVDINGTVVTLDALLDTGEMNLDLDEDGTNDAWALEGKFTANETIVVE
ncbi:MAG: hypothetical protein ACLFVJ_13860 [Persicimonas sp.]